MTTEADETSAARQMYVEFKKWALTRIVSLLDDASGDYMPAKDLFDRMKQEAATEYPRVDYSWDAFEHQVALLGGAKMVQEGGGYVVLSHAA
ncbi:MAG: hypothetical protein Q4G45_10525 [Actinomycetia bacterium]|nr:hypothetical protein [Actinomycetes bacterium]